MDRIGLLKSLLYIIDDFLLLNLLNFLHGFLSVNFVSFRNTKFKAHLTDQYWTAHSPVIGPVPDSLLLEPDHLSLNLCGLVCITSFSCTMFIFLACFSSAIKPDIDMHLHHWSFMLTLNVLTQNTQTSNQTSNYHSDSDTCIPSMSPH